MLRIGITGQAGFIGTHLFNTLGLYPDRYERIPFERAYFESEADLDAFVGQCDAIVHLAAVNRHGDPQVIYDTNIGLVKKLIQALERTGSRAQVLFSSSTQEERDNLYGQSKREGRELLAAWAKKAGARFSGMVIPNVFGPFGHPFYNSVVATFCHQLARGEMPRIEMDAEMKLIYVGELVQQFIARLDATQVEDPPAQDLILVPHTYEIQVSQLLKLLETYRDQYLAKGVIPALENTFERNLFNTFRCYIPIETHFPVKFTQHTDARGAFVEVIRLGVGGQVSFSTTVPGVTRGNHFHTRKIERFAVIKGRARIQLRRIGTKQVLNFDLDGAEPAYVDMPVWYAHNIANTGEEDLYTVFWINELYDPEDADTYLEVV